MILSIELRNLQFIICGIIIILLLIALIVNSKCRYNYKHYISILSFILSCIACFIMPLFKLSITSNDYSSIIVGLMGICATFLVGFQIYNSIDTKNTIDKINESFNEQIEKTKITFDNRIREINALHNRLKKDIDEVAKTQKKLEENISNAQQQNYLQHFNIRLVQGITLADKQPLSSLLSFYSAMKYALLSNDYKSIELLNINLDRIYNVLKGYDNDELKVIIENDDEETINRLLKIDFNNMPQSGTYFEIQDRFEFIIKSMVDKINQIKQT